MLKELKIDNFALIDNVTVEFDKSFNVLTGETGAGKSLLLDSIGLLCGNRANSDFIRKGQEKALVEGIFELNSEVIARLNSLDYIEIEEASLIMSREISLSGNNKCKINYRTVPLNIYKDFGDVLFEIHAQNQEQSIMLKDKQLNLLDKFITKENMSKDLLAEIKILNERYLELLGEYNELNQQEDYKKDLMEYYRFAVKEIKEAQIKENEDENLKDEKNIVANSEKLVKYSEAASLEFNNKLLDSFNTIIYNLKEIEKIDNNIEDILGKIEDIYYLSEDYFKEFKEYSQNFDFNEGRLNEIEERLNHINKIKSKYGKTLAEVEAKLVEMEEELVRWTNKDMELEKLEEKLKILKAEYLLKAEALFKDRIKGAEKIEEAIKEKLAKLNIYKEGFKIDLRKKGKIDDKGSVEIEFLFSGNKGEDLMPLKKVASGGEVSRIMLAFKEFFAELDFIPTLIFDEIDSGIGGETLLKIAEALEFIGRKKQVICVTHSPIIAAFASQVISIKKVEEKERMIVELSPLLKEEEIIKELSRMLGGDDNFTTAKEQSLEILRFAKNKKKV